LSTQQANETSNQRGAAVRVVARRPHLVSASEIRLQSEAAVEAGLETEVRTVITRSREPITLPAGSAAAAKRLLDVLGAVILGVVFAPLMLVILFLMRKGPGSVIYRHWRVGRNGQKLRNDPRVTPLGRFLRRTSLDELPQLMNVLRGEMSLVGPRPVIREELLRYGRSVDTYLAAKPGITGLWQVTGRNDTDYRRRVVLDTYYVRNQNLLLDLYILGKTTGVVLRGNGAY
jgi:exopolysaccharide production protein ExoY